MVQLQTQVEPTPAYTMCCQNLSSGCSCCKGFLLGCCPSPVEPFGWPAWLCPAGWQLRVTAGCQTLQTLLVLDEDTQEVAARGKGCRDLGAASSVEAMASATGWVPGCADSRAAVLGTTSRLVAPLGACPTACSAWRAPGWPLAVSSACPRW